MSLASELAKIDAAESNDGAPLIITDEDVGWLETLINEYERAVDWEDEEDPEATSEMLAACRHVLAALRWGLAAAPAPRDASIPF